MKLLLSNVLTTDYATLYRFFHSSPSPLCLSLYYSPRHQLPRFFEMQRCPFPTRRKNLRREAGQGCHIGINVDRFYLPGEQIACVKAQSGGGICLFTEGNVRSKGIKGDVICPLLDELVKHGCANCGSIPLSGDNNPEKSGILTANYMARPSCLGWCQSLK